MVLLIEIVVVVGGLKDDLGFLRLFWWSFFPKILGRVGLQSLVARIFLNGLPLSISGGWRP